MGENTTIGVAIEIPEPWGSALARYRADIGDPAAAYVPPHLTLLPPTDVPADRRAEVEAHLAQVAAGAAPFELHLRGSGTFRPVTDVVFAAVVRGISECEQLEAGVRSGPLYRDLRFPYHPHVTVAHDVPELALDRAFDGLADFEATFPVAAFTLFEHGADGHWRPQRQYPLRG